MGFTLSTVISLRTVIPIGSLFTYVCISRLTKICVMVEQKGVVRENERRGLALVLVQREEPYYW